RPDGIIAITRWEFRQPREALRVVSVAIEALHRLGVANPARHFIVVAEGDLDEDGMPVAVLAKKTPFTAEEERAAQAELQRYPVLVALYMPSVRGDNPFSALIAGNNPYAFARTYAYNIAPVTDNAPFFFFTLNTAQLLNQDLQQGIDWKVNLGVVVLGMVLIISIAAVLAFLIVPLLLRGQRRQQRPLPLLYFVAIGLGYIMVETAFIMGMPFPTGLRALTGPPVGTPLLTPASQNENAVEWAWAMNAASSVLGSVMAIIIAIHLGLNLTLAAGALAYVLALPLSRTLESTHPGREYPINGLV